MEEAGILFDPSRRPRSSLLPLFFFLLSFLPKQKQVPAVIDEEALEESGIESGDKPVAYRARRRPPACRRAGPWSPAGCASPRSHPTARRPACRPPDATAKKSSAPRTGHSSQGSARTVKQRNAHGDDQPEGSPWCSPQASLGAVECERGEGEEGGGRGRSGEDRV